MTRQICETCRFFVPAEAHRNIGGGNCHRYPPAVFWDHDVQEPWWEFPAMIRDEWCGEWRPRTSEGDDACT